MATAEKYARFHTSPAAEDRTGDVRTSGEKDRDRILYSSAFRRLERVTQVVGPLEGHVFHNRLTHTLEVGQLARRLAEKFARTEPELAERFGGIDPDVAEAAALAHDLGHPPFGHVAEQELDRLAINAGAPDGFEGNAQSFRIITRLAAHRADYRGLNLTRATLNAVLKYPWLRGESPAKPDKFGAYLTEVAEFRFARERSTGQYQSIEAAIMDYADMVAYSVHDVDDFYRAGLIPLEHVLHDIEHYLERLRRSGKIAPDAVDRQRTALKRLVVSLPAERRFVGTWEERVALHAATSWLINEFATGAVLREVDGRLEVHYPEELEVRMRFLQQLVWHHVIESPALATQQHGQRQIIRRLFRTFLSAVRKSHRAGAVDPVVPASFRADVERLDEEEGEEPVSIREARIAVDIVASLSDAQAVLLYQRMSGTAPGSVTDIVSG